MWGMTLIVVGMTGRCRCICCGWFEWSCWNDGRIKGDVFRHPPLVWCSLYLAPFVSAYQVRRDGAVQEWVFVLLSQWSGVYLTAFGAVGAWGVAPQCVSAALSWQVDAVWSEVAVVYFAVVSDLLDDILHEGVG